MSSAYMRAIAAVAAIACGFPNTPRSRAFAEEPTAKICTSSPVADGSFSSITTSADTRRTRASCDSPKVTTVASVISFPFITLSSSAFNIAIPSFVKKLKMESSSFSTSSIVPKNSVCSGAIEVSTTMSGRTMDARYARSPG